MAPPPTAAKLPVKFDASLLKIKEFIEPLAQLRTHPKLKLEKGRLKTHELEFPLSTKGLDGQEPKTFRVILTRRCDLDEKLWEKIVKLVERHNGKNCCVYIIVGDVAANDDRKDLIEFDKRFITLKPIPIPVLPFMDLAEMATSIERMHFEYKEISEKVEGFYNDIPGAYRNFLRMAVPNTPIDEGVVDQLVEVCPTIDDLLATVAHPNGRNLIRQVAGREYGDKLIGLLERGSI